MAMGPRHVRAATRIPTTTKRNRAPFLQRLMIVLLALAGSTTLMYPTAGNWFSDRAHASEISGYTQTVDSLPAGERAAELKRAQDYNASVGQGRVSDPYASGTIGLVDGGDYLEQLSLTRSGTMARVRVPTVDISLPVYHGTSEATLALGVGHLQGSALPVGGRGTNSVLTGHSGVPQARLFSSLHDVETGDKVYIDVLGETLAYEVDRTDVVLPTETDLLQPVANEDLLTLITCTPIGVNSHRLIVQAHRLPDSAATEATTVGGAEGAGFPWWAVILAVLLIAAVYFLYRPSLRERRDSTRTRRGPVRGAVRNPVRGAVRGPAQAGPASAAAIQGRHLRR